MMEHSLSVRVSIASSGASSIELTDPCLQFLPHFKHRPLSQMAAIIIILLCTCTLAFLTSFLSENSIIFTHVDEAMKGNLHAYKRITIRRVIYERGLFAHYSLNKL